ncbi:hypothetical protein [Serratia marcescens]|uniref:hypothetical protein n=1 Tax=Serratia marcescens TaxID=615 RepID=UPI004046007F
MSRRRSAGKGARGKIVTAAREEKRALAAVKIAAQRRFSIRNVNLPLFSPKTVAFAWSLKQKFKKSVIC